MKDYKELFVKNIEFALSDQLSVDDIQKVTNALLCELKDYSLTKQTTEVVVFEDENEMLLRRYSSCLVLEGKAKSTAAAYVRELKKFQNFCKKNYLNVTTNDIRCYLATKTVNGLKDTSISNSRSYIYAFYNWLQQEEYLDKNPCSKIKPIKIHEVVRKPFSKVEIDKIVSCVNKNERNRAIIEVLLTSGLRISELIGLDRGDIDFQTGAIHVRHGKGDKQRITYMSEVALLHLENYLKSRNDEDVCLFRSKLGDRISVRGVSKMLGVIGEETGIQEIHPHKFRRTFASTMAKRGMPIEVIKKLMGHENINTTMRYIHISDDTVSFNYKIHIA